MTYKKVLALVEGETEFGFLQRVIVPHLTTFGIYLTPIITTNKQIIGEHDRKGGLSKYAPVRKELQELLGDTSAAMVTTMFDYYALPEDFPGRSALPPGDCYTRVSHIEHAMQADLADKYGGERFQPFLTLHEYEGLLFTAPEMIASAFPALKIIAQLQKIRDAVQSPEEINNNPITAPSKRIEQIIPGKYQKPFHGPLIATRIGIAAMRDACPHFNGWITRLEQLA